MTKYHSDDYIKFLRSIRPDNMSEYSKQMQRCASCLLSNRLFWLPSSPVILMLFLCFTAVNVGEDCPVFDGLFEFCQLSTGGSVGMLFPPYIGFLGRLLNRQWWECLYFCEHKKKIEGWDFCLKKSCKKGKLKIVKIPCSLKVVSSVM